MCSTRSDMPSDEEWDGDTPSSMPSVSSASALGSPSSITRGACPRRHPLKLFVSGVVCVGLLVLIMDCFRAQRDQADDVHADQSDSLWDEDPASQHPGGPGGDGQGLLSATLDDGPVLINASSGDGPGRVHAALEVKQLGMPVSSMDVDAGTCAVLMTCDRYEKDAPCQCNSLCHSYGNCCRDVEQTCVGYWPADPELSRPSSAPTRVFYMYRAQSDAAYPPLNVNMASIGGVLWYLHNEVVTTCWSGRVASESAEFGYRRWKITRILRYKITYQAPEPLFRRNMNFGTRVAFDSGKNTGAFDPDLDTTRSYRKYGYHIGCNTLGDGPYPTCPERQQHLCPVKYPNPVWYSVPGPCPSQDLHHKSATCRSREPGGYCANGPTGQGNCSFSYDYAGEVNIDELSGIAGKYQSHYDFCSKGCVEWVKYGWRRDRGKCGISFWNRWHDKKSNERRVRALDDMFKARYPDMPSDAELPAPPCDFDRDSFYSGL